LLHVLIILEVSFAAQTQQDPHAIKPSPRDKTRPQATGGFQLEIDSSVEPSENDIVPHSAVETESDVQKGTIEKIFHIDNDSNEQEDKPRIPRRIYSSLYGGPVVRHSPSGLLYHGPFHGRDIHHNVISQPSLEGHYISSTSHDPALNGHLIPSTAHDPVLFKSPRVLGTDYTINKYPLLGHTSHVLHPNQLTETYEGGWRPVIYPAPYNVVHHKLPKPSYALGYGDPYVIGEAHHNHHHDSYKPQFVINQLVHEKPSYIVNDISSHNINHNPHSVSVSNIKIPHGSIVSPHIHDYSPKTVINGPLYRELPHQHKTLSHQTSNIGHVKTSHVIDHHASYIPQPHTVTYKPFHKSDLSSYGHIDHSNHPTDIHPKTQVEISYNPVHITTHGPDYKIQAKPHYSKQPKALTFSDTESFKNYLANKHLLRPTHYHNGHISASVHSKSEYGINTDPSLPYNHEQNNQHHINVQNDQYNHKQTNQHHHHETKSQNSDYHITTTTPGYHDIPTPVSDYGHPTTPTNFDHHTSISGDHVTENYNDNKHTIISHTTKPTIISPHNDDISIPQYYDHHFSENRRSSVNATTDDLYLS
ncbi:unnamed protein product, partial [Meganyctiphanes norvegica]